MRLLRRLGVLALGLIMVSAVLPVGTTSGATQTLTLTPVADATIRADRATRANGTASTLSVDNSPIQNTLLRFVVVGVGTDSVTHASLRMFVTNPSPVAGSVYRIASQTWTESVTWATAPAADPVAITSVNGASLNAWVDFDVTSLVIGDGTYSVRITSTSADGVNYSSREATVTQRPQLVVTTTPVVNKDTTNPTAAVTAPSEGGTVAGLLQVVVTAADNVSVTAVDVAVDGATIGTDPTAPYAIQWNTFASPNGLHVLTAIAHDAAGNTGISASVSVSVDNVAPPTSFTFGAAGDHGANVRATASLTSLDQSAASFYLALGDLDYDQTASDAAWCDYVHANLPAKGPAYPFEVVTGNHEADTGPNGLIANFAACLPDHLSSTAGPGSTYGAEYAFDYPAGVPLARFIMISPELMVGGTLYHYVPGNAHYDWLANEIDSARTSGIAWVVVGMHFPCLSAGIYFCAASPALMNLLVSHKVDLVLHGHEHNYQRSKQLGLDPTTCPSISGSGYIPGCVVDDGLDGIYPKGTGTIDVINGTFGQGFYSVNPVDPEAPYFTRLDSTTYGYTIYTVTASRIDARFVPTTGAMTDTFAIVAGATPFADRIAPSQPGAPVADVSVPGMVGLLWADSVDDVSLRNYAVFRDGIYVGSTTVASFVDTSVTSGSAYSYTVVAYDTASNPSSASPPTMVTVPIAATLTFAPDADASIYSASPTTNYGATTSILVDNSPIKNFLIRFTVSGVGARAVSVAKIRLACIDSSSRGGDFTLADSNTWVESTVSWSTAPLPGAIFASLGAVVTGSTYEIDLTSVIHGDGTYTLRITTTSSDGADFVSREGALASRPQLIVTTAP